jgi:hypothetical protein
VPDLENGTRREQSKGAKRPHQGQNSDWKSNTSQELIVCPGPHTTHDQTGTEAGEHQVDTSRDFPRL